VTTNSEASYDPVRYLDDEQLAALLQGWGKDYPDLMDLEQIGTSVEGRPIWACTLTNKATGPHQDKPALYVDANIHGTELCTSAIALAIAHTLMAGHGGDDAATRTLDQFTVYVLPCINPDAAEYVRLHGVVHQGNMRSIPQPDREHFAPGDVDGDGRVLSMRVEDRLGEFKRSARDERLLVPREPGDTEGPFYRVLPEGSFRHAVTGEPVTADREGWLPHEEDVHGAVKGSNQNTDFPSVWPQDGREQTDRDRPFMEPENVAVADFVLARPNICMSFSYHGPGGVLLLAGKKDGLEADDAQGYDRIGKLATRDLGVPAMHMGAVGFLSWVWYSLGIWSMSPEVWSYSQHGLAGMAPAGMPAAGMASLPPGMEGLAGMMPGEGLDVGLLAWSDRELEGSGFVAWYEVDHPQLGKVELGGWNSIETFWKIPPRYLAAEQQKYTGFTLRMAGLLPRLTVEGVRAERLSDTAVEVTVELANEGWFGTALSKTAVKQGKIAPNRLTLQDATIAGCGAEGLEVPHLEGLSSGRVLTVLSPGVRPAYNRRRVQLIAHVAPGQSTITARITSTKAGVVDFEVPLP